MECFSILAVFLLIGAVIWVWSLRNRIEQLESRLLALEMRPWGERTARAPGVGETAEPAAAPAPAEAPMEAPRLPEPARETVSFPAPPPPAAAAPPPVPTAAAFEPAPPVEPRREPIFAPPLPPPAPPPAPAASSRKPFDWEGLIGVKLFSWIAGVLLVLAAIQFLRYSIEHGWLSPPVRMAFGFATGVALLVVCELRVARRYAVTANAMDAAGIAILFATTFASYSLWGILGGVPAFALMALITAVAVWLSLRRDSPYIALLGLIGGFATPALLSTGQDRPLSLFGYLLLLNAGLAWVALRRSWPLLSLLSLIFTTMYQWAWVVRFLDARELPLAVMIFLAFPLLTFILPLVARRDRPGEAESSFEWSAAAGAALPLLFALYFAAVPGYGKHHGLLFGFLLLLDAGLAVIAARRGPELLHPAAAAISFLVTAVWLGTSHHAEAWPEILGLVAALVLFYLAAPLVLRRFGGKLEGEGRLAVFAAPLLLMAFPVLAVRPPAAGEAAFGVLVLLAAAIAGFGLLERDARPTVLAFGVAGLGLLVWAFFIAADERAASGVWTAVALAAVAGLALLAATRREGGGAEGTLATGYARAALVSLLFGQFALTILGSDPGAPSLILLLPVHLGFLAALLALAAAWCWIWPGPVSVGLTALAVLAWRIGEGSTASPWQQLLFAAGIYAVYLIYPLALGERARRLREPFLTAVLASVPFFLSAREALMRAGQDRFSGLLALAQAAALSVLLLQLVRFVRSAPAEERGTFAAFERGRLALLSGAVLAFVAAAIPLQFEREWITLGWALLAAGLAWLHLRLEHRPLLYWAAGLLAASFVRLAFNPAVLEYHPRTGVPVWNVYLYIYLVPAAAFFLTAVFLRRAKDGDRLLPEPFPALSSLAYGGGTALLFLLLNIEIADFFSRGDSLTFAFLTGQATLAEDLAYTLGWALFGIGLLVAGLALRARPARIAAIILLLCAVLKGFLHDLAQLGGLYRVASFVGLAAALALVAVLIQKFVLASRDEPA